MSKDNLLTVADFAKQAGVTTQAIYQQMPGRLAKYVAKVGKQKMIDKTALFLFSDAEKDQVKDLTGGSGLHNLPTGKNGENTRILETAIDSLVKQVEYYEKQLDKKDEQMAEKDRQIAEKDRQIESLQAANRESLMKLAQLIDQQQQLTMVRDRERIGEVGNRTDQTGGSVPVTPVPIEREQGSSSGVLDRGKGSRQRPAGQPVKKQGLFRWLFGRG